MDSGFPGVLELRKRTLELENRFIAHVVAELKASNMHMRPKEETRKRRRSADADYRPNQDGRLSQRMFNQPRRASVGEVLKVSSTGRPRRKNARAVPREMLDEGEMEVEPVRGRFPRRSKQAVVNLDDDQLDAEFAPEVLDCLMEAREPRRSSAGSSRGFPSQMTPKVHDVHDSDLSADDDTDDTDDSEENVLLPVVRPKPVVRERTLCSDHMSLTPIIQDDDEGTDTEERRRVLARRPIKTRKLAEEESKSAFSAVPKSRHRLRADYMVLFPGAEGKIRIPQPPPPKLIQPDPRSQIRLYPLVNLVDMRKETQRVDLSFQRIAPRPVKAQQQMVSSKLALQPNAKPPSVEEALPKKAKGNLQVESVDMSSVAGNRSGHVNGLTYKGVPQSSRLQAHSVLPIAQVPEPRKETAISEKPVPTQTATAASKPTVSEGNIRPRPVPPRHRPVSKASNTKAPQVRSPHSQSMLAWKSQRPPRSLLSWKSQPRTSQAGSSPVTISPSGVMPPVRIRSPEAPASRIPTPNSVVSRGSLPGKSVGSNGTSGFPASSPIADSGNKNSGSGDGFPTTDTGASLRGNGVLSKEKGHVNNTLHGVTSMDPDASQSASSTALKQVGEAVQSGGPVVVTGNHQARSSAAGMRNGEACTPHSAGATDVVHITSSSNGHMREEESQRYQGILEESMLGQKIREGTPNRMSRTQQLEEWSSAVIRPGAGAPPLDSQMVTQNNELVVRNSGTVPHLPYSLLQSRTTPSAYGVPAQFAGPSGPVTGLPSQMTGVPASRASGVPAPYAGAVVNGSRQGNMNPCASPYPSVAGGGVLVPYQMSPDALRQVMESLNSSQRGSMPGQPGDRDIRQPVPSSFWKRYNDVYKQAYLEFAKEQEQKGEDGEEYPGEG